MAAIHDLGLFALASALLALTPGADTLYIVGRTAAGGLRAGLWAIGGIFSGLAVHVVAAALGVSALLAASPTAFTLLKWAGSAYLVWLGVQMLWQARSSEAAAAAVPDHTTPGGGSRRALYLQGLLTNLLNPKILVFFLAFMPQFIRPGAGDAATAFLTLGLVFIAIGLAWALALAVLTACAAARWRNRGTLGRWLQRATGIVFIALGIRLALQRAG